MLLVKARVKSSGLTLDEPAGKKGQFNYISCFLFEQPPLLKLGDSSDGTAQAGWNKPHHPPLHLGHCQNVFLVLHSFWLQRKVTTRRKSWEEVELTSVESPAKDALYLLLRDAKWCCKSFAIDGNRCSLNTTSRKTSGLCRQCEVGEVNNLLYEQIPSLQWAKKNCQAPKSLQWIVSTLQAPSLLMKLWKSFLKITKTPLHHKASWSSELGMSKLQQL